MVAFTHRRKISLIKALVVGFIGLLLVIPYLPLAQLAGAISGSDFQAGHIIDNAIFTNSGAMSVQDIQNFLNAKQPNCDTNGALSNTYWYDVTTGYVGSSRERDANGNLTGKDVQVTTSRATYGQRYDSFYNTTIATAPYICLKSYVENVTTNQNNLQNPGATIPNGISAAQIIANAAQQYQINPEVILATLQKEQGLVTDDWPWVNEYQEAMGYSCPDTPQGCSSSYADFFKQVDSATWQFRYYLSHPNAYNYWVGNNYIQYSPTVSCGGTTVTIDNSATAALYIYTPYQPDAAALANLTGSGDSCSSYGNRNFWLFFNEWFGSSLESTDFTDTTPYQTRTKAVSFNGQMYIFYYDAFRRVLDMTTQDNTTGQWALSTLDGDSSLGGGRIDASLGSDVTALVFQNSLQVFYYDKTHGNLRHAWLDTSSTWHFENLDGDPGSVGKDDGNVGLNPTVTSYLNDTSLELFYSDRTRGVLRHAWTDTTGWHFEDLDGSNTSVSGVASGDMGLMSSVTTLDTSVQVYYVEMAQANILRHAWTDTKGWHFENLDGGTSPVSKQTLSVGLSPFVLAYQNGIQLYYYSSANKLLRHAWTDTTGWHFENLDGSTTAVSRSTADVGQNIGGTLLGTSIELFYYDATSGNLRHAWTDTTGWHFENLDGVPGSVANPPSDLDIGYAPSAALFSTNSIELFYYDRSSQNLRHAWTDTTGWHFENLAFTVIY